MSASDKDVSAEHQRKWTDDSAINPVDLSDRPDKHLQNAGARRGGEAAGGIEPQPEDPTNPAAAYARARARDDEMAADHMGDDGARSTYRS